MRLGRPIRYPEGVKLKSLPLRNTDVFYANCGVFSPKLDDFPRRFTLRVRDEGAPREGSPRCHEEGPRPGGAPASAAQLVAGASATKSGKDRRVTISAIL